MRAAVTVLSVAAALGQAHAGEYTRPYFNEVIPLAIDPSRIAVYAPAALGEAVRARLVGKGIDVTSALPVAIDGWRTYELPASARNESRIGLLAIDIASNDGAFASPVFIDERNQPLIITPDLLIGFEAGTDPAAARRVIEEVAGGRILDKDFGGLEGVYRVRTEMRHGLDVLDVTHALVARPEVRFAESDAIVKGELFLTPNDPLFGSLWGLNQANDQDMDAPEAWDVTTGNGAIQVVVLDVGIQQGHPDLNDIPGMDFHGAQPGGGPANECDNHGTAVAGCVAAVINNGIGVVGVAPDCIVKSGKIGTSTSLFGLCLGTFDSQPSMLVNALNWAYTSGARVTNSSFGYTSSATVTSAYTNTRDNGLVHCAASGNDGSSTVSYPASLASTVAVGALAASGNRASFSQYGVNLDISAPGQGISSTDRTGAAGYEAGDYVSALDGTSFASPYTAGVAALVLSVDPSLSAAEVEQILYSTAVDRGAAGWDSTYGWGFVNAHNAVLAAAPPTCPGDADGSLTVDFDDLNVVLTNWGTAGPDGDLDGSGFVDFDDLNEVLSNWGNSC